MKNVILLFVFLFVALRSDAQFALGVGGGVNISSARLVGWAFFPGAEVEVDPITAFHVSLQPRYVFARRWAAVLDLQYNRKGALYGEAGRRADYFDMMPQVEYRLLEHFGVAAGANIGFNVREDRKHPNNDEWEESVYVDFFKDQDFGLLFALRGYFGGFYGTVSYNPGLKDVNDVMATDRDGNTIQTEWYHRNLQIGVGYLIPLRKR